MRPRILFLLLWLIGLATAGTAESQVVSGRVVDSSEAPIEGAAVTLVRFLDRHPRNERILGGEPTFESLASATTGSTGSYLLTAPEIGHYGVLVEAEGKRPIFFLLHPLIHDTVLPQAPLEAARTLEVRALAADGTPALGARLTLIARARRDDPGPRRERGGWRPITDRQVLGERGEASFIAGAGERLRLIVNLDGHLPWSEVVELGQTIDLKLEAGTARQVRVVDEQGKPVAGAVIQGGGEPLGSTDERGLATVWTAGERFQLAVATDELEGRHTLVPFDDDEEISDEPREPDLIELGAIEWMFGEVVEKESGLPVPGALVWPGGSTSNLFTDSGGGYRLPAGSSAVQAAATGYLPAVARVAGGRSASGPTLFLEPAASLSGRVLDAQGRPIPEVRIKLLSKGRQSWRSFSQAEVSHTGPMGGFRLSEVPIDTALELHVSAHGFATHKQALDPFTIGESRLGFDIVLGAALTAVGQVVDGDDQPVAGARVDLAEQPKSADFSRLMMNMYEQGEPPSSLSDREGRFRLEDLDPGTYRLRARAEGFARALVPGLELAEHDGEIDLGVVVLVPGVRVEGEMVTSDGKALSEVTIAASIGGQDLTSILEQQRSSPLETQADASGRFHFDDLTSGTTLNLHFEKEGWVAAPAEVTAPTERPARFEMHPAARLTGRVVDAGGLPVASAGVNVQMARGQFGGSGLSGDDGRYVVESLPPGTAQIHVGAEGFRPYKRSGVEILAGRDNELDIQLLKGVRISGVVRDPSAAPLPGAHVYIAPSTEFHRTLSTQTDGEGRFVLDGLDLGPIRLSANHEKWGSTSRRFEVTAEGAEVELRFEGGSRVSGQVIDGTTGLAVVGASVQLEPGLIAGRRGGGFSGGGETDGDGRFSIHPVVSGTYRPTATKDGYAQGRGEAFEVTDRDVEGLIVELVTGESISGRIEGVEFDQLGTLGLMAFSSTNNFMTATVDFEGTFRLDNLSPGDWVVRASTQDGRQATEKVHLEAGDGEVEIRLDLDSGFALTGTVTRDGSPFANGRLWINSNDLGIFASGVTDAAGRFRLTGLAAGSYELVVTSAQGQSRHRQRIDLAGEDDIHVEFQGGRVTGRVRSEDGQPLAEVSIHARPDSDEAGVQIYSLPGATSDSFGAYDLGEINAGRFRITVEKEGYARVEVKVELDGRPRNDLDFVLQATSGLVLRPIRAGGGQPRSLRIAMLDEAGDFVGLSNQAVDGDGLVYLSTLPAGEWTLLVAEPGGPTIEHSVRSPGDGGTVVLPRGGLLHIEMPELFAEGLGVQVEIRSADGKLYQAADRWSNTTGLVRGSGHRETLPAGAWEVEIKSADGRGWRRSVTLAEGSEVTLRVP